MKTTLGPNTLYQAAVLYLFQPFEMISWCFKYWFSGKRVF